MGPLQSRALRVEDLDLSANQVFLFILVQFGWMFEQLVDLTDENGVLTEMQDLGLFFASFFQVRDSRLNLLEISWFYNL